MTESLEVPTGGDPAGAIERALTRLGPLYGDVAVSAEHDKGCPSVGQEGDEGMAACSCELVRLILPEPSAANE